MASRSIPRTFLHLSLFGLSFGVISACLRPDFSTDRVLQAKWDQFLAERDEYDAVFIGSSRVYRAFWPKAFNESLPPELQLRVFNFGVGSMRPHELTYHLDRLIESRPRRLKLVLVELMDWTPTVLPEMAEHPRTVAWHTPQGTWRALQTEWLSQPGWLDLISAASQHVRMAAIRATGYGSGSLWWNGRDRDRAAHYQAVMKHADGYVAFDQELGDSFRRRRAVFLEQNLPIFREQVARIDQVNRQPGRLDQFNLPAQLAQQRMLQQAGLDVVYVIPNLRWGTPDLNELTRRQLLEQVWSFNHVADFPELYDETRYFDRGHLNRAGASRFSQLLAERYELWCRDERRRRIESTERSSSAEDAR